MQLFLIFIYVIELDLKPTNQRAAETLQLKSPLNVFKFKVLHLFWVAFFLQINTNLLRYYYHYQ